MDSRLWPPRRRKASSFYAMTHAYFLSSSPQARGNTGSCSQLEGEEGGKCRSRQGGSPVRSRKVTRLGWGTAHTPHPQLCSLR